MTLNARERLIVALDLEDRDKALELLERVGDAVTFYKIGPRLFYGSGPAAVEDLVNAGKRVFLDLKFHDIPATVEGAVRQAEALGVQFVTAHATDGSAAAAAAEADRLGASLRVLAITVLTSTSPESLIADGHSVGLDDLVLKRARASIEAGCAGVVCSGREAGLLRADLGPAPILVTPGIRRNLDAADDQSRIATPGSAIAAGADYLVVGRPIADAPNPRRVAEEFVSEIVSAAGT